jgi:hypothetical protein
MQPQLKLKPQAQDEAVHSPQAPSSAAYLPWNRRARRYAGSLSSNATPAWGWVLGPTTKSGS